MENKTNGQIVSELDGMADGLAGESFCLRNLAVSFENVGNAKIGEDLRGVAHQLDLYQNDLRDYAGLIAGNDAKAAEQATKNMMAVALHTPDKKEV